MDNEWQPISTAPADGEMLVRGGEIETDLSGPGSYTVAHVVRESKNKFMVCNGCYYSVRVFNPTEWKPV